MKPRHTAAEIQRATDCAMCHGAGWIIDGNPFAEPQHLEFIECVLPDCPLSGRPISVLSFKGPRFATVVRHPAEGWVMSLTTETATTRGHLPQASRPDGRGPR